MLSNSAKKFGTFKGVFVPSTEAIIGTVLFLLLPTLTADIGFLNISIIIILAHTITLATSFSLADCTTNLNKIEGGGMYSLSKKSLGKAFGGSIGIQLYLAQAASIGFYCIGFATPIQSLLSPFLNSIPILNLNNMETLLLQKQIIASIVFILFFIIVLIGANFTLSLQMIILYILIASVVAIFASPLVNVKFNGTNLFYSSIKNINLFGYRTINLSIFFLSFTIFFPAVTGISAGVGMSGDLKNPKKNIVKGTFLAIIITFIIYIICTLIFSLMKEDLVITAYNKNIPEANSLLKLLGLYSDFPNNILGTLILAGILFATSSSALSSFLTAPRTAQSLCNDDIFPSFLNFIGKDFTKKGNEPRFATVVTFFIGLSVIWLGNLKIAAIIVGLCFLIVYAWINISAFLERISNNPSFRPTSKNHWIISLYGFASASLVIMLFSITIGILILISQIIIFWFILKYKTKGRIEGVWWGVLFSFISKGLKALNTVMQGTKNWRPILSAFTYSGEENCSNKISILAEFIASYKGLVNINILHSTKNSECPVPQINKKIPSAIISVNNATDAIMNIIQIKNIGGISANTFLLEYSEKIDLIKILNKILLLKKNVLLLVNGNKLNEISQIDIWWRGERNGNFMVLLSYIIKTSLPNEQRNNLKIRIIRKLNISDTMVETYNEMNSLLEKSRLNGEITILPNTDDHFIDTLYKTSKDSDLILLGLPGNYINKEENKLFNLDKFFFKKEINKYNNLPAIIFVKSAYTMNLVED